MSLKSILLLEPFSVPLLKGDKNETMNIRKSLIAYTGWILYKKFKMSLKGLYSIPLALAEISAIIKNQGVETYHVPFILEALKRTLSDQEIEKKVSSFDFDEVWMSNNSTETAFETIRYAKIVKTINNSIPVMVGGIVPSFSPEFFLKYPEIDFLIRGQAEVAVKQYVKDPSKENFKNIQGFCFKDNGNNHISKEFAIEPNLNKTPPFDFEGLCIDDYMKDNPYSNIQFSRGCPFNCPFCAHTAFYGLKTKYRPIKSISKEIKVLQEHGCEVGYIIDSTFTLNKKKLIEFADACKKNNNSIKFWFETRTDKFTNEIAKICKPFSYLVWFGAESGSPNILKYLQGKNSLEGKGHIKNLFEAIRIAKDNDFLSGTSWVIGLPGESKTTIQETKKVIFDLFEIGLDIADPRILQIFPGTEFYNNPEKYNLRLKNKEITSLSSPWDYSAAHDTESLTSDEIIREADDLKKAILEYYLKKIESSKIKSNK